MRVLVLGGTLFMGHFLVYRLLAAGHAVTIANRGVTPDPFGDRVQRLRFDRTAADLAEALGGRTFDAAVDFTAYVERDAREAVRALGGGRVGHYVLVSSGQVYLVREGRPTPARETDYEGPLVPKPEDPADHDQWAYGMGKRECEDVLVEAWESERFPATRLRIPMVNGPRDPRRRIERYVARMLDGGPLIVPDGGSHRVRHVYVLDVVEAIMKVLVTPWSAGQAYNWCQDEAPRLCDLLQLIGEALGAFPRLVAIPSADLAARGLDPVAISPFSSPWMSFVDPTRAAGELGLRHQPLLRTLETTVACCLAHPPDDPPPDYERRQEEIALAEAALAGQAS